MLLFIEYYAYININYRLEKYRAKTDLNFKNFLEIWHKRPL